MKELSIEEKAKRYDEALHKAKNYYSTTDSSSDIKLIGLIFPELKESDDEKIRKALIKYFSEGMEYLSIIPYNKEQCVAWLEKQGKHANFRNKIQIGDKVTRNEDGVLVNLSQLKRVAKKDEKQGEQKSFAKYKVGDTIYYNSFGRLVNFVIANIVEDGTDNPMYEDKDGNPVFQNDIVEQKPADKVDVLMSLDEAIEHCKEKSCGNNACALEHKQLEKWLTELKELKEQKSAWSEEDIIHLNNCISYMSRLNASEMDWLKSLRPQPHWKPSDEQMRVLDLAIRCGINRGTTEETTLVSLFNDLKKLK